MPAEFQITMLGPTNVGKTSLLTAMYDQFNTTLNQVNLHFFPHEETSAKLNTKLRELKSLKDEFETSYIINEIRGTRETEYFKFDIGKPGKKPFLTLTFVDYPGGYLSETSQQEFIRNLIYDSVAVIIPIHAPALMEEKGRWNEYINYPTQIKDFLGRAFQELEFPKLIIYAPIKCEKYVQTASQKVNFIKSIREDRDYKKLNDLFRSESLQDKVVSVLTPVQTIGTVIFSRIEEKEDPYFYFRKISHDAKYDPRDCEQPLLYLIRFILRLEIENRRNSWFFLGFLRDWLNLDGDLKESLQKAVASKNKDTSVILQGQNWLNL